jgi:uncharacterized iron-regulated membrane protein
MLRSKHRRADAGELTKALRTPHVLSHTEAVAWPLRLARFSRWIHKWVGTVLALIMVALSITGVFIAFKNELEYLQPAQRSGAKGDLAEVIPPARVAEIILALQLPEAPTVKEINRIELRPSKRMYKVRLEQIASWRSPRELQVDAITGAILNDGVRGDQLWMDLHSFAVFGEATKLLTMTVSGIALLWLSLSGHYLFFYPLWFRARKRRTMIAQSRDGVSNLATPSSRPQAG